MSTNDPYRPNSIAAGIAAQIEAPNTGWEEAPYTRFPPRDTPIYEPGLLPNPGEALARLLAEVPWETRTDARSECFMATRGGVTYTYGSGRGVRTYTSIPFHPMVEGALHRVNQRLLDLSGWGPLNVCFLNRYDHERHHLGWHADDHPGTDHTRLIAVVSLGSECEIWWRTRERGAMDALLRQETPAREVRHQRLTAGSLFVMPPGFQQTHEHRIPKSDRACGPRVSLTFRAFLP